MAQAAHRPPVRGPTFIRLLARLTEAELAPSGPSLPDRLGQWLDWKHALALAAALDARPAEAAGDAGAPDDLHVECTRAREMLAAAINDAPLLAPATPAEPDYAAFRQLCLNRQRATQAAVGRLRGKLRDALAASPGMSQLAEVDAATEVAITPREHTLLAKVPDLLGQRFERLRTVGDASTTWLDSFRRDMRSVLLAELDLRFQPVDALLAALRTS